MPMIFQDEYIQAYKQSRRREDDIAIVNSAMRVRFVPGTCEVAEFRLAFGGMAATTVVPLKTVKVNVSG